VVVEDALPKSRAMIAGDRTAATIDGMRTAPGTVEGVVEALGERTVGTEGGVPLEGGAPLALDLRLLDFLFLLPLGRPIFFFVPGTSTPTPTLKLPLSDAPSTPVRSPLCVHNITSGAGVVAVTATAALSHILESVVASVSTSASVIWSASASLGRLVQNPTFSNNEQ